MIISREMTRKYTFAVRLNCSNRLLGTNDSIVYFDVRMVLSPYCSLGSFSRARRSPSSLSSGEVFPGLAP